MLRQMAQHFWETVEMLNPTNIPVTWLTNPTGRLEICWFKYRWTHKLINKSCFPATFSTPVVRQHWTTVCRGSCRCSNWCVCLLEQRRTPSFSFYWWKRTLEQVLPLKVRLYWPLQPVKIPGKVKYYFALARSHQSHQKVRRWFKVIEVSRINMTARCTPPLWGARPHRHWVNTALQMFTISYKWFAKCLAVGTGAMWKLKQVMCWCINCLGLLRLQPCPAVFVSFDSVQTFLGKEGGWSEAVLMVLGRLVKMVVLCSNIW